ncbi:hypothetical protein RIF29_20683 [Crotalaria pallida]|uniref:RNA helicase n=1 Tax=Crotalaria pallida TaxID=3830 RepID=A0AAN9ICN8_CROPI
MEEDSIHRRGNGNENYVPFDIENESARRTGGVESPFSVDGHRSLEKRIADPISIANILKSLFFIIVWYTFSLLLTLYNKSLLGNDMGKFPAPFMMNTIHFALQAVLSKLITWFWSQRFQTNVAMSWAYYFLKEEFLIPYQNQEIKLKRGVDIVIGTPGRIKDHIERGNINLSQLRFHVLDEADEMLRMGFV